MTSTTIGQARVVAVSHGRPVTVRAARADDDALLADLVYRASVRTRWLRYFQPLPASPLHARAEGRRMAGLADGPGAVLLASVAEGAGAAAVAVGELALDPLGRAGELALLVRDDHQGQGLGLALGRQLVALARARGLAELHGHCLPENRAALRLARRLGAPVRTSFDDGLIHIVLGLADAPRER